MCLSVCLCLTPHAWRLPCAGNRPLKAGNQPRRSAICFVFTARFALIGRTRAGKTGNQPRIWKSAADLEISRGSGNQPRIWKAAAQKLEIGYGYIFGHTHTHLKSGSRGDARRRRMWFLLEVKLETRTRLSKFGFWNTLVALYSTYSFVLGHMMEMEKFELTKQYRLLLVHSKICGGRKKSQSALCFFLTI